MKGLIILSISLVCIVTGMQAISSGLQNNTEHSRRIDRITDLSKSQ